MITYDNEWHERMGHAAEVAAKDPTINTRLNWYLNRMLTAKVNCPGAPEANAMGILVNVLGYLKEEAEHHIKNELIIRQNRK